MNECASSKLEHENQLQQQLHFQTSDTQRHEDESFLKKNASKVNTCVILTRIIIAFANQTVLILV